MVAVEIAQGTREPDLTDAQKLALVETNHIWVNAFNCVRPSDDFCLDVGREVIRMLNESPVRGAFMDVTIGSVLYLRVNKS